MPSQGFTASGPAAPAVPCGIVFEVPARQQGIPPLEGPRRMQLEEAVAPTSGRAWDHPRLLLSLALGAWGWFLGTRLGTWTLGLDDVNLAIHETGHLVFSPFGEWMTVAGGTLFQLLVPLAFAAYFVRKGDRHAATVPLWWAGQNLFGIARYVSDARAQELPLVGGGEHDWTWMLYELDVLHRELEIGRSVHAAGILVVMGSVALGVWMARRPVSMEQPPSS
jgi:hypothetical protein